MEEHKMSVARTAQYYTLGRPSAQVRYAWLVCHGYGQTAERFLQKFVGIAAEDVLIIAPEALSRFYWQGFTGEPVATWMTRRHRLDEIADYCAYLTQLQEQYRAQLPADVCWVLLGFSQGATTMLRWAAAEQPVGHHLVAWAGEVPRDLDYDESRGYFAARQLHYRYGTRDEFLTPVRVEQHRAFVAQTGLAFDTDTFDGGHTVEAGALAALDEVIREN